MPPYDWAAIARGRYDYLIQKLKYAENFYDLFRIDHAVGVFRIWTIPVTEPLEKVGLNGVFDPPKEARWEDHGSRILSVIVQNTRMLPCAEDLGTVPECSTRVLRRFGIPGMDIQRWMRDWQGSGRLWEPEAYRENAIASLATHDMTPVLAWWKKLSSKDLALFRQFFGFDQKGRRESAAQAARLALQKINASASIFSIQLLQDWMSLLAPSKEKILASPLNDPGTFGEHNWSWVSPYALEDMLKLKINQQIQRLNQQSGRQ